MGSRAAPESEGVGYDILQKSSLKISLAKKL